MTTTPTPGMMTTDFDSECVGMTRLRRAEGRGIRRCVGSSASADGQAKRHQCLRCLRVFLHSSTIDQHAIEHTKEKSVSFKCMVCYAMFATHALVRQHAMVHKTDCLFGCNVCQKFFSVSMHLAYHHKINHQVGLSCHRCFKHFSSVALRTKHLRFCRSGRNHYNCHICGDKMRHKEMLKKHIRKTHLRLKELKTETSTGTHVKMEDDSGDMIEVLINDDLQRDNSWMEEYGDTVQVIELEDGETVEDLNLKWHRVGDMMEGDLRKLTKRGRFKGTIQHHVSKGD